MLKYDLKQVSTYFSIHNIGKSDECLRVKLDRLLLYLSKTYSFVFSPSKYEETLKKELEDKVLGKPLSPERLLEISQYAVDLAEYLDSQYETDRARELQQFQERAREGALRARKNKIR